MSRRNNRFSIDPARVSYTPTVKRKLLEEPACDVELSGDLATSDPLALPHDEQHGVELFGPANDSDLPLPKFSLVDGDECEQAEPRRAPRDSLDLASDSLLPQAEPSQPSQAYAESDSLAPLGGARAPGRQAPAEHVLWSQAGQLLTSHQFEGAADLLERLCIEQTNHEQARAALVELSIRLGRPQRAGLHAAWLMRGQLQSNRPSEACRTYRRVRAVLPNLSFPEALLIAIVNAADRSGEGAVVLDATNLLVRHHASSSQTSRALLLCAKHQLLSGAEQVAQQTLRYVVAHYANDATAEHARRKLAELARR